MRGLIKAVSKVELGWVKSSFLLVVSCFCFACATGEMKYNCSTEQFGSPIIVAYYGDYLGVKPGIHLGIERPLLVFRHQRNITGNTFPNLERSLLT